MCKGVLDHCIFWISCFWEIVILPEDWDISIPIILDDLSMSVTFHLVCISFFISTIISVESAKRRRSSRQTVTIAIFLAFKHV